MQWKEKRGSPVYTGDMNTRNVAIAIVALLVICGAAAYAFTRPQTPPTAPSPTPGNEPATGTVSNPTPPATTTLATSTPEKESDTAALNQRIYKFGVHITPLEVISDSRCPMGVYCIQAGTVTLKVKLEDATHSEIVTMVMGSPVAFGNKHVALLTVTPPKPQSVPIKLSDYRFTFSVAYGMGGEAPQ